MRANNIYDSVKPLYIFTYICGLTPTFINTQSIRVKVFGYVISFIHLFLYAGSLAISLYHEETIVGYFFHNGVTRIGDFLQTFSGILLTCIILIYSLWRNATTSILKNLELVDAELTKIGFKFNYNKSLNHSYVIIFTLIVVNCTYYFGSYDLLTRTGVVPSIEAYTAFCMPYFNIALFMTKFMSSARLITLRITMLSDALCLHLNQLIPNNYAVQLKSCTSIKCSKISKKPYSFDEKFFPRINNPIKVVMQIHNSLCDTCEKMEDNLGYQILAVIAVSFLYILFDSYYILQAIVAQNTNDKNVFVKEIIGFFVIQLFVYIIVIVSITEVGHNAMQENQKTMNFVHKILSYIDDGKEKESLIALSLQLRNRDVRFSAAGLFYLDRTLYFTIAGATTTYLIILIQFSSAPSAVYNATSVPK